MKLRINKEPYISINNFIRRIKKEWRNLAIEFAEKLGHSMEYRVALLTDRKSDYINYQDDAHIM
jgi:hypothetical protein